MKNNRLPLILLVLSCLVLVSLVIGGGGTYTSAISASEMQNLFIVRTLWHGGLSIGLQIGAVLLWRDRERRE